MLTVTIDHDICVGTRACMDWLPAVFSVDEDGLGVVLDSSAAAPDEIIECARGCPTAAIRVVRGGETIVG